MAANNPYDAFNFLVVIDGVPAAAFSDCILPAASIDVVEYREGSDVAGTVRKLPGLVRYGDLVLKRGISNSPDSITLWDWFSGFLQGNGSKKTLTVTLLNSQRNPVVQWNFTNAWPTKYEAPPLNAKTNSIAIETLVVAVEGMTFSLVGQVT